MNGLEQSGVRKHIDPASLVVILMTLVLFLAALVVKGFGHDILLEAGVFLVSVKLIIMAYKSGVGVQTMLKELAAIRSSLARLEAELASARSTKQAR